MIVKFIISLAKLYYTMKYILVFYLYVHEQSAPFIVFFIGFTTVVVVLKYRYKYFASLIKQVLPDCS